MRNNECSRLSEKADTTETNENPTAGAVSRHAWLTLTILSSTLLTVFFSETMLLPAIPGLRMNVHHYRIHVRISIVAPGQYRDWIRRLCRTYLLLKQLVRFLHLQ
jgi:hypothetical protein